MDLIAATPELAHERGRALYVTHCAMCHQENGLGVPGVFPPLVRSDSLARDPHIAIRAIVAGLKGKIVVNGQTYDGQMPAMPLDDVEVADTVTFLLNSWDNRGGRVTVDEVRAVRATTALKTFAALQAASDFGPLPLAPELFAVTELLRLPDFATRMTGDAKGRFLYVLGREGGVWRLELATRRLRLVIAPNDYYGKKTPGFSTLGITIDSQNRLWITANARRSDLVPNANEVTIFRTSAFDSEDAPIAPKPWFRTEYPFGVGPYNHGISAIRFGPDGLLYVSSGSRTDAGEPGNDPRLGRMGEVDLTACVWRLNPNAERPVVEVIARGIRNAYGLAWDGDGELFSVSNGPDAHAPEEMDHLRPPRPGEAPAHHGFPFQFGDSPAGHAWYPHQPAAPAGLKFVLPVLNLGPAGTLNGTPLATFTPHSCPTGIVWLDESWPETVRRSFLIGRFGNFIDGADGADSGYDVLSVRLARTPEGGWTARTTSFLTGLGRPIDLHLGADGSFYILEYTRTNDRKRAMLPGRILKVSLKTAVP